MKKKKKWESIKSCLVMMKVPWLLGWSSLNQRALESSNCSVKEKGLQQCELEWSILFLIEFFVSFFVV